jgi:hypothetical protein
MSDHPTNQTTDPRREPNGLSADTRIAQAIQNLCDQFAICGHKPPVAIVVEATMRRSGWMLTEDVRYEGTRIWGVEIREALK